MGKDGRRGGCRCGDGGDGRGDRGAQRREGDGPGGKMLPGLFLLMRWRELGIVGEIETLNDN